MADDLFTAWATDRAAGRDSVMLAPTRDLVAELNQRARTHRLAGRNPGPGVALADGNPPASATSSSPAATTAGCGSAPPTGSRTATAGPSTQVHRDGSCASGTTQSGRHVTLPADYVAELVELGYACTTHTAQGITADTCHGLLTGDETRQQAYTMLTRGRRRQPRLPRSSATATRTTSSTPRRPTRHRHGDQLESILARDEAPVSATTTAREHAAPTRLGAAAARYRDALHFAAEHHLGTTAIAHLETGADRIVPGISDDPAWPTLRAHLVLLAATGADPLTALELRSRLASSWTRPTTAPPSSTGAWATQHCRHRTAPLAARHPPGLRDDPHWRRVPDRPVRPRRRPRRRGASPSHQHAGTPPWWTLVARSLPRTCSVTWLSGAPRTPSLTATTGPPDPHNPSRPTPCGSTTSTPGWETATPRPWPPGPPSCTTWCPPPAATTTHPSSHGTSQNSRTLASMPTPCFTPPPAYRYRTTTPPPPCWWRIQNHLPRPQPARTLSGRRQKNWT